VNQLPDRDVVTATKRRGVSFDTQFDQGKDEFRGVYHDLPRLGLEIFLPMQEQLTVNVIHETSEEKTNVDYLFGAAIHRDIWWEDQKIRGKSRTKGIAKGSVETFKSDTTH
jgi:hypothetical protein